MKVDEVAQFEYLIYCRVSELPHDLLVLPFGDEYDVNSFSPFKKEDFEMEHGIDISRNE